MTKNPTRLRVEPLGVALGALVEGADVRGSIAPDIAEEFRIALDQHQVIVVRNQMDMTDEQQIAFASIFGVPGIHEPTRTIALLDGKQLSPGDPQIRGPGRKPYTDRWHSDVSYSPRPPTIGSLRSKRLPKVGGDTAFVSLCAIYDALSAPMKQLCSHLEGVHSISPMTSDGFVLDERVHRLFPDVRHPLVMPHPRTGRKAVYIGAENTWLQRLVGIEGRECDFVLRFLRTQLDNIEFQFRWKWSLGDVVVWDQRAVNHMGLADHYAIDPHRELYTVWCYPDDKPQVASG